MLVLDDHTTHKGIKFIYTVWINVACLQHLEPHTSHAGQSFDGHISSPLKTAFHQETRPSVDLNTTAAIREQRFLVCAREKARDIAVSQTNIIKGFKGVGN